MISQTNASFRLQCAAETLENIKNDLRECVDLKLRQKKPTTIRFWDELNPKQPAPQDSAVSDFKSTILEEKIHSEERTELIISHPSLLGNAAANSAQAIGHHPFLSMTRSVHRIQVLINP
jgi:hypothetical protein